MATVYFRTKLHDIAGAEALNRISVSELADGDRAFVFDGGRFYLFFYDASATDEENLQTHPYKIRPYDYSTGGVWTEQKRYGHAVVDVTDFGAVGDGSTDDYAAISDAVTAAHSLASGDYRPVLYFPPGAGYAVTSTVTVNAGVDVVMDAPLVYAGTSQTAACLVIGQDNTVNQRGRFRVDVIRNTTSDWSSEACVGVKLVNLHSCDVRLTRAKGFTIGCQALGWGDGFVHNVISLGRILNNKIGLDLVSDDSDVDATQGWVNENLFLGGNFAVFSGVNQDSDRIGVRITNASGSTAYYNNSNVFVKPSFELNFSDSNNRACLPILVEYGSYNEFLACRNEGNHDASFSPYFAEVKNGSAYNVFEVGYGAHDEVKVSASDDPVYFTARRKTGALGTMVPIFTSGDLTKKMGPYDNTNNGRTHIAGCCLGYSGAATIYKKLSYLSAVDGWLDLSSRAVGVMIDTRNVKRFYVQAHMKPGEEGRIIARCYDASDNILDSSGPNHPYVKGEGMVFNSGWGGVYMSGSDRDDQHFMLHDDVKKIVLLVGGTCKLNSFTVYAEGPAAVSTGYFEPAKGQNMGIEIPNWGTWETGQIVWNDAPSAGGNIGWVCVAGGSPGTWKTFGAIAS